MAYKADIQLAVKGLRELRSLNIHLDRNGKAVDRSIEKIMKYNSVTRSHFVPTLNNLSSALAKAQANFDKANISTVQGIKAAENLAKAEKLVNAELIARNSLMGTVRGRAFGPQQADAGQTVAAQKQQAADQEKLNQAMQKTQSEQKQQFDSYLQQQQKSLVSKLPEFSNPEKASQLKSSMKSTLNSYGFNDQEIAQVNDHRIVMLVNDAMKYRNLQKAKPNIAKKISKPGKVFSSGVKQTKADINLKARKDKLSRLRKSGSTKDAASIFLDMINNK